MPFSARPLHTCMNHLRRIVDKHLPSKLFIKSNNAKKKKKKKPTYSKLKYIIC